MQFFFWVLFSSASLFLSHSFFLSQQVPRLISLMVAYWAKHSTGGLLEAGTQPHCPWSNYSKKERTFLLFCEGAFPWLPSSPAVESTSAQLLLHSEPTRETKRPAETWWVPAYYQHRISDLLQAQKNPQLIFTATYSIWLNIRWVIFPWSLTERHQHTDSLITYSSIQYVTKALKPISICLSAKLP